ncbi:hypothetical protein P3X46_016267 [Hevea brasiliensis]|uniref:non-specific serine/threonine protein kinase n=1 Tax=Hevea brasiliensis TaxID=3981 RepID=A0ABQ9M0T4_HEVBR|nr:proline-rich receptor-like protein kinase PERK8 [Hevea brasiliensis]XP_058009373.1 proline-rich receptor-like protein kinase PERK8 [Hevea brasiliensis]KAJ9173097.1 hypothetical protein P3X46_016267 [Hevea brasiliensis]
MASTTSPSPTSSPSAVPPTTSSTTSLPSPPPAPSLPSNSTATSPLPATTLPNQTTDPPVPSTPSKSSAPPPQSSPPSKPAAPPPSPPSSPPPSLTTPSAPPPLAPPPSPPASPPPAPPTSPPQSTPIVPPPAVTTSPPPPDISPPPPPASSPPSKQPSPTAPVASPPSPQAVAPSPPSPVNVPTPPSTNSPPPPPVKAPESSPAPPNVTPPSSSQSGSPPTVTNSPPPPTSTLPSPPTSVPSTSLPPVVPPPAPPDNSSTTGTSPLSPLPSIPTEKPTAKATNDSNVSANTTSTGAGNFNTGAAVAIGIVVGFIILSFLVMAVWVVQKRKRRRAKSNIGYTVPSPFASSQNSESLFLRPHSHGTLGGSPSGSDFIYSPSEPGGVSNSKSWFTYEELVQATNGFSTQNLLGEGGFGCVYKGILVDGREVAVKQLKMGGSQGEREFKAEVEIISRVHHRHLVSLVGYCISENQRLLIYDYVPNNTLHYHLHDEGRPVMDWAIRVKVAAGAARGIAYLHEDCHPRIIHRDIKSSNILLDDNFEARVSDFGLAKIALELDSNTHVTTRVMGTFGYMAPEYATSGKLTEKSDVYSFGVVLLELITGRKPVDASQPLGDESLVEWARPLLAEALDNEDFEALVDPRLEKNYVAREMFRMIEAAAACVRHSAAKRPRMSQVVRALGSLDELSDLSNGMKPGQSEIFDSRQHSAQIRMFQKLAFGSQDYSSDFFDNSQSSWQSREHSRGNFIP